MASTRERFNLVKPNETVLLNTLVLNRGYLISKIKLIMTRYGPSILCHLKFDEDDEKSVFLPSRYNNVFSPAELDEFIGKHLVVTAIVGKTVALEIVD